MAFHEGAIHHGLALAKKVLAIKHLFL